MDALAAYLPQTYAAAPAALAAARSSAPSSGATPKEATPEQRARAAKTAQDFEASFLTSMLGEMFEGTEVSEPFGGGEGESAFRSFMTEAMAKSMARHGGIGLARSVTAEMLKLQGLR